MGRQRAIVFVLVVSTAVCLGLAPGGLAGARHADSSAPAGRAPVLAGPAVTAVPGRASSASRALAPLMLMAGELDAPATQLRITLGQLLAEHAFLVLEAIRGATLHSADAVASKTALDTNSSDLAAAIGSVYGSRVQTAFDPLWRQHIDLILDYANAKAADDQATMDRDRKALDAYRTTFSRFLARANPYVDASAEAEALRLHIEQLLAYTDSDFDRAYAAQRAAFEHMFMFGDQLALAISKQFPKRFSGANVAFTPAAELRIGLDRLLGEHLVLTAEAMRAVLAASPDADAARRAIADNTAELRVAVANIYGDPGGDSFVAAWQQHIDLYLTLIGNVANHDAAGREATVGALNGAEAAIVDFFAGAIPGLPRDELTTMVREHVAGLVAQLDAYAASDYSRAYLDVHDSYRHMFDIGQALAAGIAAQFPDRFATVRSLPATDTMEPSATVRSTGSVGSGVGFACLVRNVSSG